MSWKKTNEAWFGDTFDRSGVSAMAYNCSVDSAINADNTVYTYAATTCDSAPVSKSISKICLNGDTFEIKADVSSITNKVDELQAQIDDLKKNYVPKTVRDDLRSALKTLHYKREVE